VERTSDAEEHQLTEISVGERDGEAELVEVLAGKPIHQFVACVGVANEISERVVGRHAGLVDRHFVADLEPAITAACIAQRSDLIRH